MNSAGGEAGSSGEAGAVQGLQELTVGDLVGALERNPLLAHHSMVWRLHNKLLMQQAETGAQQQPQEPVQEEGVHGGAAMHQ